MRVAVTGISSYLARSLFPLLNADPSIEEIRGLDVKEPFFRSEKLSFIRCDIRDPGIAQHMKGCDTVIHLAYIVMPIRDETLADDININGSQNVFRAATTAGLNKIIHLSSVSAYGAWPDNPGIITEDHKIKGMPSFYYSRSKAEVELFLDKFEKEHYSMVVTRFRPCIFIGPAINNVIKNITNSKILVQFLNHRNLLQLVWDEDVAHAIHLALKGNFRGSFNLAGDGVITPKEMAKIMGARLLTLPYSLAYWAGKISWALKIGPLSSGWIECMRYPIIVSSQKAKTVLGWNPTFDTTSAFRRLLETLPEVKS